MANVERWWIVVHPEDRSLATENTRREAELEAAEHDGASVVEVVPASQLRGAVEALDEDAAARVAARWLNRDDHTDNDIAEMTAEMLRAAVGGQ